MHDPQIKYFSTFSGIGGFELGIERGIQGSKKRSTGGNPSRQFGERTPNIGRRIEQGVCVGFSEIDKYASQIYQHHFPEHRAYGDITKIRSEEIADFDLLVGGFPCQAFSIAGKRMGFKDTRGTMFFELARILADKQPRLFVFENVKGLLSHDEGRTIRTIFSTIDELGYDADWQVLNSKDFGVPQNRERIIIVGHLRGTPAPEVFPLYGSYAEAPQGPLDPLYIARNQRREVRTSPVAGTLNKDRSASQFGGVLEPVVGTINRGEFRETNGLALTIPASYYKGHDNHGGRPMVKIPEATKQGYAEARPGQSINLSVMGSKTRRGRVSDVAQTLDTGMQQHTLTEDARIRRLTPLECERLQGFPEGWTEGVSDTQRYKTLGNAVTVNVIEAVMTRLLV